MSELPVLKSRDMVAHLTAVGQTHQQIVQGIRDRATEHEAYLAESNAKLNGDARVAGRVK